MATADVVMATIEPMTNTGSTGTSAMKRKLMAPSAASQAAARDTGQPDDSTRVTIQGASINPALPPAATSALLNAPASNQRTAIRRRKVAPAVSRMPADKARHRS